jgi:tripartite-type tricarboxylate transporter receptor subunit TctC
MMPGLLRLVLAVLAGSFFAAPLHAQIGEQPIRIIFPFAPGGSGDTVARLIANKMNGALNRPVIVENRPGADGRIGVKMVKDSAPDGSTLLLTPIAPLAIYQHFYTHLDYDPIADFAPLSQLGTFDFGIAVGPQTDAKTLKDLVDWAKANPADANYAIPGAGTLPHFLGVMFGRAAKIDLRPVPYHGSAAGLTDLVAGHIPIEITTTADLVQWPRPAASASWQPRTGSARRSCRKCRRYAKRAMIWSRPAGTACSRRRRRRRMSSRGSTR